MITLSGRYPLAISDNERNFTSQASEPDAIVPEMNFLPQLRARNLWIRAQKLDIARPFGKGPSATRATVEHLGYVQIDTINVIERCHHHILYNRIPDYQRADLQKAQAQEKSVFEYWTHALAYVPTRDYRFFMKDMRRQRNHPGLWFQKVRPEDLRKVRKLLRTGGALSIRDIKDDVLVEKEHDWASSKPSKRALQLGFYSGELVVVERQGMLKKYDLASRHWDWIEKPKAARENEIFDYKIDRALRSQGVVSLDSICHLVPSQKPAVEKLLRARERKGELVSVFIEDNIKDPHWLRADLDLKLGHGGLTHLLSPFDPLVIQRKRLKHFFNYEHKFEAYIPSSRRQFGYFALPVLMDDRIVAAIDLKTDRQAKKLLVQKWTWIGNEKSSANKLRIEQELHRFEKFQLESF